MSAEQEKAINPNTMRDWVVPIVVGLLSASAATFASLTTFANQDRQMDIEMVRISLSILKGEFQDDAERDPSHARRFALRALSQYSGVALSDAEIDAWVSTGVVPYSELPVKTVQVDEITCSDYADEADRQTCITAQKRGIDIWVRPPEK